MKKHVLFIVENRAVPPDRRVWKQAVAVMDWGYHVSVICRKEAKAAASYEQIDGIDIYRHPMPADRSGKWGYFLEYSSALFFELVLAVRLYWDKPFHVIHAANPPDTIFAVAAVFKLLGVKYIFDIHDLCPELFSALFRKRRGIIYGTLVLAEKLSCKVADAVITTNQSYSEIVSRRHNVDEDRLFVVRNDPSVGEFDMPEQYPRTNGTKVILYLGSINSQDGVESLMHAIHFLVNTLGEKNINCIVIGDGQAFESVKSTVSELGLLGYVDLKGYVLDRAEIRKYLNTADICVEPAPDNEVNRHSTFIKILEFMAAGKPVVAFDLKESRFSADGAALFATPGDIEGFARAISDLLHDPVRCQELGEAGRARIKKRLNWENSLKSMKNAYERI